VFFPVHGEITKRLIEEFAGGSRAAFTIHLEAIRLAVNVPTVERICMAFLFLDVGNKDQLARHCIAGTKRPFEDQCSRLATTRSNRQLDFTGNAYLVACE
jgi:hypothetical protein